jgi:hypothetical protein
MMGSYKLAQINNEVNGYVESRDKLYYNKYKYRARYYCRGLEVLLWAHTEERIREKMIVHQKRYGHSNLDGVIKFFNWREKLDTTSKNFTIRTENNIAAVFSNDLDFLRTLEGKGCAVDYTMVDESIPAGVKYFKNEPKHKYRFHLKSRRVNDGFALQLAKWIEKYKGTNTVIEPSAALKIWLEESYKTQQRGPGRSYPWRLLYTSGHYYIDYDEESTLTLFMLVFDGMISKKYKLLKRPY